MKVLELIPTKPASIILSGKPLSFNKIEKFFFKKQLELNFLCVFNAFLNISKSDLEIQLDLLTSNDLLKVNNYDLECVSYGLDVFKKVEISEIMEEFEFRYYAPLCLITEHIFNKFKYLLSKRKQEKCEELLFLINTIKKTLIYICDGKGLSYYRDIIEKTKYDLKYLDQYIKALE